MMGRAFVVASQMFWPFSLVAQQPIPPDCSGARHREFDFWVGEWQVIANGKPAGTNEITLTQKGCILHEHWTGSGGGTGESFNFYDRTTREWSQVWVDSRGMVLRLKGSYADGKMLLTGETQGPQGVVRHRLTFFDNSDGTVRQLWEQSRDEGRTWTVAFDGLYRKKSR